MALSFFDNLISYSDIELRKCELAVHDENWTELSSKTCYDIWIITEGGIEIESNDYGYSLTVGDLFFLCPDNLYRAHCVSAPCKFVFIHFDFKTGGNHRALDGFSLHGKFPAEVTESLMKNFLADFEGFEKQEPLSFFALKGHLTVILSKMIHYRLKGQVKTRPDEALQSVARLQPIFDYISENTGEMITVKDLAQKIYLSEKYFNSLFKKILFITPGKYITDLKLNKALDYLREGKHSVKEIASKTGYCDQYAFSKAFKRKFGVSPTKLIK